MNNDTLSIMGMTFHAHHGLDHDEIKHGQRFEVDVKVKVDIQQAAKTDSLHDTIDVRDVYNNVRGIVVDQRFYLIETVSQRIADCLLQNYEIDEVTVRVRKPFAPLGGLANGTQIEITRKRS